MRVDVWADIVCPWCYLGKARFAAALSQFEHRDEVEVVYHSFELDPGGPGRQPPRRAGHAGRQVRHVGAGAPRPRAGCGPGGGRAGLHETGSSATPGPRTGCCSTPRPGGTGRPDRALVPAYFGAGRPVFDAAGLAEVAAEAGLDDGQATEAAMATAGRADGTTTRQARRLGITGVPFYVIGGSRAVSGGQPAEVFLAALRAAWDDAAAPHAAPA